MSSAMDDEATISIPSIAFVAVLGYIIYRYFWSSSSSAPSSSTSPASRNSTSSSSSRYTAAQVDQVSSMFPQLNRRDIMWDLQRNRGNVQATTERIITTGRLEAAPQSFVPSIPVSATSTATTATATRPIVKSTPVEPDLLTRYNLKEKVDVKGKGKEKEEPNHGWSSSKDERQAMLQRRRDEMILAARRKMQERDSQQSGGGAATSGAVSGNATSATSS